MGSNILNNPKDIGPVITDNSVHHSQSKLPCDTVSIYCSIVPSYVDFVEKH